MFYSDNPERDFDRWDRERERRRAKRPKCAYCDEHIQDDELYDFDGELVCPSCVDEYIKENYKKRTTDYIKK